MPRDDLPTIPTANGPYLARTAEQWPRHRYRARTRNRRRKPSTR